MSINILMNYLQTSILKLATELPLNVSGTSYSAILNCSATFSSNCYFTMMRVDLKEKLAVGISKGSIKTYNVYVHLGAERFVKSSLNS